jgi:hypothetical protein
VYLQLHQEIHESVSISQSFFIKIMVKRYDTRIIIKNINKNYVYYGRSQGKFVGARSKCSHFIHHDIQDIKLCHIYPYSTLTLMV